MEEGSGVLGKIRGVAEGGGRGGRWPYFIYVQIIVHWHLVCLIIEHCPKLLKYASIYSSRSLAIWFADYLVIISCVSLAYNLHYRWLTPAGTFLC